jgi:hypothetical protein
MMVGIGGTISIIQIIGFGLHWKIPFICPEISRDIKREFPKVGTSGCCCGP